MTIVLEPTGRLSSLGDILNAIRQGDGRSKRLLYEQTVRYAASVCSRYLSDDEDVKDALQETYVTIFSKLDKSDFKNKDALMTWIGRIAMTRSIDLLRRRRKDIMAFPGDLPDNLPDEEPDVSGIPQSTVLAAIRALPEGYRTVLNMYVFEQMSHKEIAKALGITEGTSASQYHRAKAVLAEALKNKKDEEQ